MKKLTLIFAFAALLVSCGQSTNESGDKKSIEEAQIENVVATTIEALLSNPQEFEGKEVVLTGMVTHVCKHGGQKCFVLAEDGETQLKVNVGTEIDEFDPALEGSTVEFKGVFKVLNVEQTQDMLEDHDSKEHHENEMPHSKAEKASYFMEATSYKEIIE